MDYSIGLLDHPPWTLTVLIYLQEHGFTHKSEMVENLGIARQSLYSAVDRLRELDFVFEDKKKGFPQKTYVDLTVQGRKLAESLVNVEGIVSETIKGFEKKLEKLRSSEETAESKKETADMLCRLGELSFARGKWDHAIDSAMECEVLSREIGDVHAVARSNWILGEVNRRRGEIELAVDHFQRSSELFIQLDDKENLSEIHYSLGALFERKGNFDDAVKEYDRSRDYAKEVGFEISHSKALIGIGRIHGRRGEYDKSYGELLRAVRLLPEIGAEEELALAYGNLGATAAHRDNDEAIEWYTKSVEFAKISGNPRLMATGQMNIASCFAEKSEFKLAIENLERAKETIVGLDDKKLLASLWIQFGIVQREHREWTESRESLFVAIDTAKKWDLPYHEANALFNMALLDIATSSANKAKNRLERALRIFEELGNESKASDVRETLESISQ
jgi:tetratricopeptide (TPR) repeat protein